MARRKGKPSKSSAERGQSVNVAHRAPPDEEPLATAAARHWLAGRQGVLILAALLILSYSNTFTAPFVFDGRMYVELNENLEPLWKSWQGINRPVGFFSFALNRALHGRQVWGYHVVNLLIHFTAACALLGIARRTLELPGLREKHGPFATVLAWCIAALWCLHPLQTQSVTYVYQRLESQMGMFYLLSIYCLLRGAQSPREPTRWWFACVACALLAVGTKEVAVTLPVMALWYDRTFLAGSFRELLRKRWLVHAGLASSWLLLAAIMTSVWQLYREGGVLDVPEITPWEYFRTQPLALLHYLRLSFWPKGQCLDYAWQVANEPATWIPAMAAVTLLGLATAWAVWRRPHWGFLGVWFFVILGPTSSFAPIIDLIFEHRMYLSLAAVAAAVVLGGFRLAFWAHFRGATWFSAAVPIVAKVVVGLLCLTTWMRNRDYASEVRMWRDCIAKQPQGTPARAWYGLGHALYREGKFDESITALQEAIRIQPRHFKAEMTLVDALIALHRHDEAVTYYRQILADAPAEELRPATLRLANFLVMYRRLDEAAAVYDDLILREPDDPRLHDAQGHVYLAAERFADAEQAFRRALQFSPDQPALWLNLGLSLARQEKHEAAIEYFARVAQRDPQNAEAHANLAQAWLAQGNRERAIAAWRQALQARPGWPLAVDQLRRLTAGEPASQRP